MARPADPELADRIVRATADLLEEHGIEAVTMRAVASAVGCSATTIYQRFENKDGLLDHAVARGLEWFVAVQEQANTGTPTERLTNTSRAYVEWGITNPALYRLMFEQRLPRPADTATLTQRRRGWDISHAMLTQVLGNRAADASGVDAAAATDLVFISLHGIVSLAISGRLIGPTATTQQRLDHAHRLLDHLIAGWVTAWDIHDLP
jgi:AcrR family transcriptional regulator